jgi:rhomboid family GlyGly-CTERM serine protease
MITNEIEQVNDKYSTPLGVKRYRGLLLLIAVVLLCIGLSLGGENARIWLQYDRTKVASGELWRLVTAHLVHGSSQHSLVNLLGLVMMWALFNKTYRLVSWIVIVACGTVAIDLGFWFLMPELHWYVGLSGVLHAVLAAGTVAWWKTEAKALALLLTVIMIGKLLWEQFQGALPLSGDLPVIVNAHLYGEIGGLVGVFLCRRDLVDMHLNTHQGMSR